MIQSGRLEGLLSWEPGFDADGNIKSMSKSQACLAQSRLSVRAGPSAAVSWPELACLIRWRTWADQSLRLNQAPVSCASLLPTAKIHSAKLLCRVVRHSESRESNSDAGRGKQNKNTRTHAYAQQSEETLSPPDKLLTHTSERKFWHRRPNVKCSHSYARIVPSSIHIATIAQDPFRAAIQEIKVVVKWLIVKSIWGFRKGLSVVLPASTQA